MSTFTLNDTQQAALGRVRSAMEQGKRRQQTIKTKVNRRYALYRSYQEFRSSYEREPRDRDEILHTAKREWGAELFIPYCFRAVETTVPRILSSNPTLNALPAPNFTGDLERVDVNAENIQVLLHRQQDQMDFFLRAQDIVKDALIYGLGAGKVYWKKDWVRRPRLVPPPAGDNGNGKWTPDVGEDGKGALRQVYDDPAFDAVDILDFFWDPYAYDVSTARWLIHRTWRDDAYLRRMVDSGTWQARDGRNSGDAVWDTQDLLDLGPTEKRDSVFEQRNRAGGNTPTQTQGSGKFHEVWEFHDRERVITVLDGQVPVQQGPNPFWHGELPFHIFRPTRVPHEFMGIGVIEPIEHLNEEMNTLRSQRRDNATLKLQQTFAYFDGLVDPEDLKFGPGLAIPVSGDPKDLLFPINVGDIPNSGYREEDNLIRDLERMVGLDDPQPGQMTEGTATGAQIVQAAANVQIQLKAQLLGREIVKPVTRQVLELDQQMIRTQRRVVGPPKPEEPERRWSWYEVGPAELQGEWVLEPEEGSTQPVNVAQDRQDAVQAMTLFGQRPEIEPEKLVVYALKKFGVENPKTWLRQQGPPPPPIPPEIAAKLARAGVDPHLIETAQAQYEAEQEQAQNAKPGAQPPLQDPDAQAMAGIGSPGGQP